MKKILLISRGIPSKQDPMWGNFELDQALALKKFGNDVVVMSIDRRIRFYWRKIGISKETVKGIHMYNFFFPLPYKILPRFINNYFVDLFAKHLYRFIEKNEGTFDIVHGHYLPNIRIANVIGENFGINTVGTEHWSELKRKPIKNSVKQDAKETYPHIDRVISVSKPLELILKDEFNVDSTFVGCVIDDVFKYEPKIGDHKFKFIAVGSLFKIKGFDIAIKAFSAANFGEDIEFHIIGEGDQRAYLEEIIKEENVSNQVKLLGRKTRSEIMEIMQSSSAYILSSRSENFATACMEALSAGLPAIMTKCGGPEDFVDETNSILVEVDNIQEMAEAMEFMVNNFSRYNSELISKSVKSKYSATAIATQLNKIYESI
ncbi:glycosyltransferase family 4 protein [Sphingobacterium lactis]|uniref:Glycosyltransferase involved in cell wall bisynthesis n=1 Tax=Sphingobacterium lactis TaxID=797291 RepID=A0A1H5VPP0_9SPHI|nr:glycosyltransferase family 4 protein [Sphingobacterium lactis]SEF88986.1 Glycosyltransferase involved in cell wall bisynthesis [Sphingobacterium lactis]